MRIFSYFLAIVVFGLILWGIKHKADKTELSRQLQLTSASNEWKGVTFSLGKADHYNLVLGLPRSADVRGDGFCGKVALSQGSRKLLEIPFDAAVATPASWLMDQDLNSYILTWPTNSTPTRLDAVLETGRSYTATITFSNKPPSVGSLWLTYLQEWKDRKSQPVVNSIP